MREASCWRTECSKSPSRPSVKSEPAVRGLPLASEPRLEARERPETGSISSVLVVRRGKEGSRVLGAGIPVPPPPTCELALTGAPPPPCAGMCACGPSMSAKPPLERGYPYAREADRADVFPGPGWSSPSL